MEVKMNVFAWSSKASLSLDSFRGFSTCEICELSMPIAFPETSLHLTEPSCIWPLWNVLTTYLDPISSYPQGLFQGFEWCHLSEITPCHPVEVWWVSKDFCSSLFGGSHWNIMNYIKMDCDWQPFRGKDSSLSNWKQQSKRSLDVENPTRFSG